MVNRMKVSLDVFGRYWLRLLRKTTIGELEEIKHWEIVTIKLPPRVRALFKDQMERIKNIAEIDPEGKLPDEVADGLALELMIAEFSLIPDEELFID